MESASSTTHPLAISRPIAEGLFDSVDDTVVFRCGRCRSCGHVAFPALSSCPACASDDVHSHSVPGAGTLWTYTIQMFRPKPPYVGPEAFEPYGVGYVLLGNEIMIEGRLTVNDPTKLVIGMRMRAVPLAFATDNDGTSIVTFAFAPEDGGVR